MSIFCIGRNYVAHIEELGNAKPEAPVVFCKLPTSVNTGSEINLPTFSHDVHFETELLVKIGTGGKHISEAEAAEHIAGFGIGLDLTARDVQSKLKAKGLPWEVAKAFDGAACMSEFLPAETFPDLTHITFLLELNGKVQQQGDTALMLFPIAEQIAYISAHFTLSAGDVIYTGTPSGVAQLHSGDNLALTLGDDLLTKRFTVA